VSRSLRRRATYSNRTIRSFRDGAWDRLPGPRP
jgi:hypothetical protein